MKNTIVIPCYNEERRLAPDIFQTFLANNTDTNLLFVDDGSTDSTNALLQTIKQTHPKNVDLKKLQINQGKAEAVRQGILQATTSHPNIIGYLDADLSTSLSEAIRLIHKLQNSHYDIIIGSRIKTLNAKIKRNVFRHYLGRIFATFASNTLKLEIYDTQCGAKFFKNTNLFKNALAKPFISKWAFDIELIARLTSNNTEGKLLEEPLQEWINQPGSKLNAYGMCITLLDMIKIAYAIKKKKI